jgi:hypothetical protein
MSEALLAVRRQAERLSVEEQLQLIAYLAERIRQAGQQPVARRQWRKVRGAAPYPLRLPQKNKYTDSDGFLR